MLEKDIEKYLDWVVSTLGGATDKFKSPSNRGVADRIVYLKNGETWFIELKKKGGVLSVHQKQFQEKMLRLHQNYACLWSITDIDNWVNSHVVKYD